MMSWLWRLAMEANKPRRQQLVAVKGQMKPHIFAVIRLSWYRNGRLYTVEEMNVENGTDETPEAVIMLIKEALKSGADVTIQTACKPQDLGIE
jgi:hypothetical protein